MWFVFELKNEKCRDIVEVGVAVCFLDDMRSPCYAFTVLYRTAHLEQSHLCEIMYELLCIVVCDLPRSEPGVDGVGTMWTANAGDRMG